MAINIPKDTDERIAPCSSLAYRHFINVDDSVIEYDYRSENWDSSF